MAIVVTPILEFGKSFLRTNFKEQPLIIIQILISLFVLIYGCQSIAAPEIQAPRYLINSSGENSTPYSVPDWDSEAKKIHKGDSEIATSFSAGYSSFSGVLLDVDLAYSQDWLKVNNHFVGTNLGRRSGIDAQFGLNFNF